MAAKRTLINVNYALQRVEHGEQAPWLPRMRPRQLDVCLRAGGVQLDPHSESHLPA
jgi:hypothetical protein